MIKIYLKKSQHIPFKRWLTHCKYLSEEELNLIKKSYIYSDDILNEENFSILFVSSELEKLLLKFCLFGFITNRIAESKNLSKQDLYNLSFKRDIDEAYEKYKFYCFTNNKICVKKKTFKERFKLK